MKAFLLAAGRGTRLRPYTDTRPKCLMPIGDMPLLEIWLNRLQQAGVEQVLINTHHHAEQVRSFVAHYQRHNPIRIVLAHEPQLLGSAGTLWRKRDFVADEADFWVIYADNLSNLALGPFWKAHAIHRQHEAVLTMGLFEATNPQECGIAELDAERRIVRFCEKPRRPASNLANAGIYVASQSIFRYFPESCSHDGPLTDLGYDLLPRLAGRMFGYPIDGYLRDIGTVAAYHQALRDWPALAEHRVRSEPA